MPTPEHEHADEHDLGLAHDLATMQRRGFARRGLLGLAGTLGLGALVGCGSNDADRVAVGWEPAVEATPPSAKPSHEPLPTGLQSFPDDMAGPFPADGSNGPDILEATGVVRRDLTRSVGTASGVAPGVPLKVRMRILRLAGTEAVARTQVAVYAWHCDRNGDYSMYDGPLLAENFLRGIQISDDDGWVEFDTIFPGCYPGRWPHVHFEVFPDVAVARLGGVKFRTSQLAFPEEACRQAYRAPGYEKSAVNLRGITLETDLVFQDGWSLQMADLSGDNSRGWVAEINVPV